MTKNDQHQGKLLSELLSWKRISRTDFAKMMGGKSRQWVTLIQSYERIPRSTLLGICSMLKVPEEYFNSNIKLEDIPSVVQEPDEHYLTESKKKDIKIHELQEEVIRLKGKIIELQERLIDALALQKTH
jgi:DNA-binding Xre family transcriptional regulator